MNSVVLIGRLTRDPELSYTPNTQTAVCKFTLAVDRPRKNGQDQGADFLRITVFGRQAENCNQFLEKGRQAGIHGRIETGSYKNREGVTVYTTDIMADYVEFLGGGQDSRSQNNNAYGDQPQTPPMQQAPQQSQGGYQQQPMQQAQGGYQQQPMQQAPQQSQGGYQQQPMQQAPQQPQGGYQQQPVQQAPQQMDMNDMSIPDSFQAAEDDIPF